MATTISYEIIDFLATSPAPQQILEYHTSETMQERLRYLLQQNKERALTPDENAGLDEIQYLNHLMAMLKAKIRIKMMESKRWKGV